jgi:hypothetical protein
MSTVYMMGTREKSIRVQYLIKTKTPFLNPHTAMKQPFKPGGLYITFIKPSSLIETEV